MKKNTLIKLLSVVLVCVLLLPMVVACNKGPQYLITLDANGGTLNDDVETEFYRGEEEKIGKLPTPIRKGYTFLGWYDVDDTTLEEKITRSFEVEYDMDLIAQWQRNEGEGALVTVELVLNPGESLKLDEDGNEPSTVIELEAGDRLGKAPDAEKEGFRFKGWYNDKGVQYTQTSVINADIKLTAKWEKINYCIDGTENHDWASTGGYKVKRPADCVNAEILERTCGVPGCGIVEQTEGEPAYGHDYTWNTDTPMQRTGVCKTCSEKTEEKYTDVTLEAVGDPTTNITIDCAVGYGLSKMGDLVDNNWTATTMCSKAKPITVTLDFANVTYVDLIYVAGQGTASYVIKWFDEDGEEIGFDMGAFGKVDAGTYVNSFEIGKEIAKIEIKMAAPSDGQDYWGEIRLAQYPKE